MRTIFLLIILLGSNKLILAEQQNSSEMRSAEKIIFNSALEKSNDSAQRILKGDISLLKFKIDYLSLATLSKDQLRILRNEIFAQYGYIFKTQELTDFFSQFSWYKALSHQVNLTDIDNDNVQTILLFENSDIITNLNLSKKQLAGFWQDFSGIAAGWSRRIIFDSQNRFIFLYSQMRELPEIISFAGNYEIVGSTLRLKVLNKTIIEHSNQYYDGPPNGFSWEKEKMITEKINTPYYLIFPIENIKDSGVINHPPPYSIPFKMRIGGRDFYKFEPNPETDITK